MMRVLVKKICKAVLLIVVMVNVICATNMKTYADGFDTEFPYVVTIYNEKNGLPTGEANTVIQSRDGHIWIGSYGGLIRYDGSNFRNYSTEKLIDSDSIRSLYEDSQGRLWIGTNDNGVVMMQNDEFINISNVGDNSFACIRDFAEDKNGDIFVASPSGMAKITNNGLLIFEGDELSGKGIYSIAIDKYNRIWGCTDTGECIVLEQEQVIEVFTSAEIFDAQKIYCIDDDEEGNIYMGTSENVVAKLSFPTNSLDRNDISIKEFSTMEINYHNVIEWVGGFLLVSGNNGLAVISPDGNVKTFGEKEKAMSINAATADYESNLWLASSNYGVIKYSQGCFEPINKKADLEGMAVNAIVNQNKLWYIGTDSGILICNRNWKRLKNNLTSMFEGVRVRSLASDSKGNIWIASYSSNPLVCYQPLTDTITCFNEESGLLGDKARVVKVLSKDKIITSTQNGVYILQNNKVVDHFGQEEGLLNAGILCVEETEDGEILLGSDGEGIYCIRDGKIENNSFEQGLKDGVVLRMKKENGGNGYFVSAGSDLYYWDQETFNCLSNFTKDAGSIFDIYDKDGKIWILQNNGIISMNKEELLGGKNADTTHYSFMHGLNGSLDANTWHYLSEDGKLYLATRNGISIFGFTGVPNTTPKMCISRAVVDGAVYEHPKQLILPSNAQRVTIEFATLSYTNTIELRVSTYLKGFDNKQQMSIGKSDFVSYTNLPGGEYQFEVTVFSPEDGELAKCVLPIVKEKKLTEYPVFWVLLILFLIILSCMTVFWCAKAKIAGIQRRQQEYKSIIEQSLKTFAKAIDAKDAYTNGHSLRVAEYTRELAKRLGMSELEQENIYYIALLHDIGKIGIPDSILNKPGKLTDEELEIIRRHTVIGGEILQDFTALEGINEGAKYHHERWDGKGYSEGLAEMDIPKVARIIGVADSYDAMSSNRCYRKALPEDVIKEELINCSGTQFDPEVVPHMLNMMEEGIVPMKEQ